MMSTISNHLLFMRSKYGERTNDLYTMMRLSYEQATDDYNTKKADSLVNAYKNTTK